MFDMLIIKKSEYFDYQCFGSPAGGTNVFIRTPAIKMIAESLFKNKDKWNCIILDNNLDVENFPDTIKYIEKIFVDI